MAQEAGANLHISSVLTIFMFGKHRSDYSLPDGFLFGLLVSLLRQFLVHHHQGRRDEGADARKGGEDEKATVAKGLLK